MVGAGVVPAVVGDVGAALGLGVSPPGVEGVRVGGTVGGTVGGICSVEHTPPAQNNVGLRLLGRGSGHLSGLLR